VSHFPFWVMALFFGHLFPYVVILQML